VIHQGQEMGYPSRIELTWDEHGVHLGGEVARDEVRVLDV
jgi:predicted PhzF superfamily epimerase YddE/YHI9